MFSTFPDEWPGAGLLLLRATAGVGLIVQGIAYLGDKHDLGLLTSVIAVLMIAVGTLILTGCVTRFAAAAALLASVLITFSWFPGPRVGLFESPMSAILAAVIAGATVCLGAGAYSVDARLFGRREVIIPEHPPHKQA